MSHSTIRPELPPLPPRIAKLPLSDRGYPVPWFVQWLVRCPNCKKPLAEQKDAGGTLNEGVCVCDPQPVAGVPFPEFRIMDGRNLVRAVKEKLCWVCGEPFRPGERLVFVIGPMCAVNRVSSEPPSHRECAEFSAIACPFLSRPKMVRREGDFTDSMLENVSGHAIRRNPGVTLLWVTRDYKIFRPEAGGVLFTVGNPLEVVAYAEGKLATKEQIRESVESGYPILKKIAEDEGLSAIVALALQYNKARKLLGIAA
jgi:hypothetical protein